MTKTLVTKKFAVRITIKDLDTGKMYSDEYIIYTYCEKGAIEVAKRRAWFDYPIWNAILDVDYAYEVKV